MKRGNYRSDYPRWYGIYGIEFVWHGEWSDAEIRYKDFLINEHCVLDSMIVQYREECPNDKDYAEFAAWMYKNRDMVREQCQYVIDNRADFGRYVERCR